MVLINTCHVTPTTSHLPVTGTLHFTFILINTSISNAIQLIPLCTAQLCTLLKVFDFFDFFDFFSVTTYYNLKFDKILLHFTSLQYTTLYYIILYHTMFYNLTNTYISLCESRQRTILFQSFLLFVMCSFVYLHSTYLLTSHGKMKPLFFLSSHAK